MLKRKKQHNRRWEKRPQLYKGRYYYIKRAAQIAIAAFCVIGIIATLLYFQRSDTLFIKNVVVTGKLKRIQRDDVIVLSQITKQDKLFSINLLDIKKKILKHPWVEDVHLRREFPDTIQIDIKERQPLALLKVANEFYIVDHLGKAFKTYNNEKDLDLPIISGFQKSFVDQYPELARTYLKSVLQFYKNLKQKPFYQNNPISEIHHDPVFGFTVFTQNEVLEIYYGRSDILQKQHKLERFVRSKHFDHARLIRLDLDAKNKVIAREL